MTAYIKAPALEALCARCKHRYGVHSWGVTGPCTEWERGGCPCPHFTAEKPLEAVSDAEGDFW